MKELIEGFAAQMKEAVKIGEAATLQAPGADIHNVLLIGLGGSAFGGEIVKNYIEGSSKVPFGICRDYAVPAYVSENTLLLGSSYSGNTEETLSALASAEPSNPQIACVTSGGKLMEIARNKGYNYIQMPGGYPPRTAAGLSITQQLYVLRHYGVIGDFSADLQEAISVVENFSDHDEAQLLAQKLKGKLPVMYSSPGFESIPIRWRQQIEENSKHIAFHHVVPEMNHNELVGWKNPTGILSESVVIFFRTDLDNSRIGLRMDINRDIIADHASSVVEVSASGSGKLAQLFYLLHFGDWVSFYLSEYNEEDPMPVKVIDFLKGELAKV